MRSHVRRAAALVAVLAVATVTPAVAAEPPPGGAAVNAVAGTPRVEIFAVTLNGDRVSEGSTIVRGLDGMLYATLDDAHAWRIELPPNPAVRHIAGVDYVAIGDLAGLESRVDETTQTLALSVDATKMRRTDLRHRVAPLDAVGGSGSFVDYDLRFDRAGRSATRAARLDLGTFFGGGLFESEVDAIDSSGASQVRPQFIDWTRLNTHRNARLRVGSMQVSSGAFGDGASLTGVSYASDRTTAPGAVVQPLPVLEGVASGPSLVEVYADGALIGSATVPSGPFSLQPATGGSGTRTYAVVVTDAAGHRSVVQTRAYLEARLLPRGTSEFEYTLGSRHTFNRPGDRGAVFEASRRTGVTDRLTVEADVEAGLRRLAGVELTWAPAARLGTFVAGGALSNSGNLSDLGYRFGAGRFSFTATSRLFSPGPPLAGFPDWGASRQTTLGASLQSSRGALTVESTTSRDQVNHSRSASLVFQRPSRAGTMAVRLSRIASLTTSSWEFDVAIARHLGRRDELTTSFGHGGSKGNDAHGAAIRYTRADDDGRLVTSIGTDPRNDTSLEIDGRLSVAAADIDGQLLRVAGTQLSELHVRGAASFIGGRTFFAPWIQQSYGLVRTGYPNVPVRLNNVEVGTTDRHGDLFLPALAPLHEDTISIDPSSLPIGVEIETEHTFVPFPRAGIPVRFATTSLGAVRLRLVLADGSDAPAGATLTYGAGTAGRETIIAEKGLVYLDGVTPGPLKIQLAFPGTTCSASLRIPAAIAQTPDLGTVTCR